MIVCSPLQGDRLIGLVLFEGLVCGSIDLPLPPLVYGLYLATQVHGGKKMEPDQFTSMMRGRCLSVEDQLNFVSDFKPANWTQIRYGALDGATCSSLFLVWIDSSCRVCTYHPHDTEKRISPLEASQHGKRQEQEHVTPLKH